MGRGLGHLTPTIFGIRSNVSFKLLELETSNLIHGFVWRMTGRRIKISRKSGRGLGHVTPTIFGSTVGYPSDSLDSCLFFICICSFYFDTFDKIILYYNFLRPAVSFYVLCI